MHLQNFKMLQSISEKKLAIFASTGSYLTPGPNNIKETSWKFDAERRAV